MRKITTVVAILVLSMLAACTDHEGARRVLADGYDFTNIQTFKPGFLWNGCSDKDFYATGFTATNAHGKQVSGVVCAGGRGGKMSTVRFD